jgi:hypothetical protein
VPHTSSWLIPSALFIVLGLAASLYLSRVRLPHESRAAGLRLLSSMAWGDFVQLVLAVLNGRGYERSFGGAGTEGEYLLQHRGQQWLLSGKHSRAWTPGSTGIAEFAAHLRQIGLQGGILAIPGKFPPAALSVGRAHRIELLDGPGMWNELEPALSDEQQREIEAAARKRLRAQYALAWIGAAVIAVLAGGALRDMGDVAMPVAAPAAPTVEMPAASNPAETLPAGGAEAPTPAAAEPPIAADPAPTTAASPPAPTPTVPVEERRTAIANAVDALPHVSSAHWPTPSTLLVQVDNENFDPHAVCPLVEADPELGTSRLQVQYPPGSGRPVRFLQCRAF